MKPLVIRRFRLSDLPALMRIERESFSVDAWPEELFRWYALSWPELFLIANIGRSMVGYAVVCGASIDSIATLPRYRGRGVATALLRKLIRGARRSGRRALTLMVRRENEAAIALYRKFGFVRTATVSGYYEDGATAWRMRLVL